MTPEERIAELETNYKAMSAEIEKFKAELAEKNETVWIPKCDDSYMYIDTTGCICSTMLEDNTLNNYKYRIDFNNVYHSNNTTREHLKWYSENVLRVQNKLMQLHELLCPDYFPDWENNNEPKFYLCYNYGTDKWYYDYQYRECNYMVYFTAEAAEKACKILNQEKFMMENNI